MEKKTEGLEEREETEVSENSEGEVDPQAELLEQIATLKDVLLRKTAESENLRKRLEKEKDEAVKYSNKSFARDLLWFWIILRGLTRVKRQCKVRSMPILV